MISTRDRIVSAAARLLAEDGRDAVSTRAVSAAAGVQAPAIYRLFGDKQGLLDAVASRTLTEHFEAKAAKPPGPDPVQDLREGWDEHVAFGLANPALYTLIHGDPRTGALPPAVAASAEILAAKIHRIAAAGRLRVPEPRAVQLVHAAGSGTTLALIGTPEDLRDPALSGTAREAVIAAIVTDAPVAADAGAAGAAVALRAALPRTSVLSAPELALLGEWLDRIAAAPQ